MRRKRLAALLVGSALGLMSTSALADTFTARYPSISLLSSTPSIHAAMAMGAYGFGGWQPNDTNWRNILMDECARQSLQSRTYGVTQVIWYHAMYKECNPWGITNIFSMGTTIPGTGLTMPSGQHWVYGTFKATEGPQASSAVVQHMISYRTPSVIHLYSNWDHWATISKVVAAWNSSDKVWEIDNVTLLDAVQSTDLSGKPTLAATTMDFATLGGTYWYALRFPSSPVCSGPVTCPAGFTDPWNRKYNLLFEPPVGTPLTGMPDPAFKARAVPSVGVTSPGEQMSARLATDRVLDALRYASVTRQSEISNALASTNPGPAVLVQGFYPSGARWDYYLVPMLKQSGGVSALVMLYANNGAFQQITLPDHTLPYQPVDENRAREVAQALVKPDERLGAGSLTWNPEFMNDEAHSPFLPYFEFVTTDKSGQPVAHIRISHNGGRALGRENLNLNPNANDSK